MKNEFRLCGVWKESNWNFVSVVFEKLTKPPQAHPCPVTLSSTGFTNPGQICLTILCYYLPGILNHLFTEGQPIRLTLP